MSENALNLYSMCRSCKFQSDNVKSLFDSLPFDDETITFAQMLTQCTQVQIELDDGLPGRICEECVTQLRNSYMFKRQCQTTDRELRTLLKDIAAIKLEQVDVNVEVPAFQPLYEFKDNESTETCEKCTKSFTSSEALEDHVLECTESLHDNRLHETYICKLCNKSYKKIKVIKRHMLTHARVKPCVCEKCNRRFLRLDHLQNHEVKCKGDKVFACHICNRGFNREEYLEVHVLKHKNKPPPVRVDLDESDDFNQYISKVSIKQEQSYPCEDNPSNEGHLEIPQNALQLKLEELEPDDKQQNSEIVKKETESLPFCCGVCDRKFVSVISKDIHMSKHTTNREITCSQCNETFLQRRHFKRHVNKIHFDSNSGFTNRSESILENIADPKNLDGHVGESCDNKDENTEIQPTSNLVCNVCDKKFSKPNLLASHMLRIHPNEILPTFGVNSCRYCTKSFSNQKYRRQHEKLHKKKRGMNECKTCGRIFKTKLELQEHMKLQFECAKKYLCSECGQRFIRNDYLVVHMRRHRGEKPYKCKYCSKGFPRTTDLTVHERYHTGEKTHLCTICGRGFGRAYNLTVHMRTHTGEKPYQCTYCNASFAQGNDLKTHVRRHTGERYHCELCSATFIMAYMLTHHKRTVHNLNVRSHIRRLKPSERFYYHDKESKSKKMKASNRDTKEEDEIIETPKPVVLATPAAVLKKSKRQRFHLAPFDLKMPPPSFLENYAVDQIKVEDTLIS